MMLLRSTGLGKDTSTSEYYAKRFDLRHQLEKKGAWFDTAAAPLKNLFSSSRE